IPIRSYTPLFPYTTLFRSARNQNGSRSGFCLPRLPALFCTSFRNLNLNLYKYKNFKMNPDELFEIIKSRRAVFPVQYNNEEITESELNRGLESANWASNHKRTEPWRFRVIRERAKQGFAEFIVQKYMDNTPAENQSERKKLDIIDKCNLSDPIILIHQKTSGLVPEWEELAATSMAVQNMW